MHFRLVLLVLLTAFSSTSAGARAPFLSEATLRPSAGGAVLEVTVSARDRDGDTLRGIWVAGARTNLLRCQPRCKIVSSIPVQGQMLLGGKTMYRVVLGGRFLPGQKVGLVLSFAGGNAAVEATVGRETAWLP
ncbi:hypothetical protein [Deinococcus peraridilitoris]|uniref:hypothetical protein n=1 Tax=Deinococcus peraridilitoris TaxID=432329 RepID=UPI001FE00613|nr:hypothetical protein [Deinococcus peraridilitoris]